MEMEFTGLLTPLFTLFLSLALIPTVQRIKRTRISEYVQGDGWMLVAMALATIAQAAWHTVALGVPQTPEAVQELVLAGAAAALFAGWLWDRRFQEGKYEEIFTTLLGKGELERLNEQQLLDQQLGKDTRRAFDRYARDTTLLDIEYREAERSE